MYLMSNQSTQDFVDECRISDLPDRFIVFLVNCWLLELSHFEIALTILASCIRALVDIVPFLVALETLHIL